MTPIPHTIEYRTVPLSELHPHPDNPRRGDVAAIGRSIDSHGQYRPIVVNRRTMEVLAGNHTLRAASKLGWERSEATFLDVDEQRAKRILLVDNRTNDLAGYDTQELADLLEWVGDLGTGYDEDALGELLDELAPAPPEEDEPLPLHAEPETPPGDLLVRGPHRLLCADARDPQSYARMLGDERAELLWTDPPYGVDYEGKTGEALRIRGDGAAGLAAALLSKSFAAIDAALSCGARLCVAHPAGALSLVFAGAFVGQGWKLRQTLVWVKEAFVLGHSDYHYRHEPILYGHKRGEGRIGRGARGWFGDHAQDSVLEVPRPRASREHPTMKPPALVERCLRNSARRGESVLDPFAGSGSTLVACESSGRSARLIELDRRYCDVIVGRFERLTGERAERERR